MATRESRTSREVARACGLVAEAVDWAERGLTFSSEQQIPLVGIFLSRAALAVGDLARAQALLEPHLAGFVGNLGPGVVYHWAGRVAWQAGERAVALGHQRAALRHFRTRGEWVYVPDTLEAVATIILDDEQATAVRFLATAAATRTAWGLPRPPIEQPGMDATLALACTALGDDAFADAWTAGTVLPLQEAVEEALVLLDGLLGAEEATP